MSITSRLAHHERLVERMADRNGVDLELALQSGALNPGELQAAVLSCAGCAAPEDCETRLDRGDHGIPGYCRNADMLRSLAGIMPSFD
ncbi:MAG: DUF6455 family protein [Paracoccaceae bacterium]|nr:DUF6455 family protein [Paracoccaceae bacterium]